MNKNQILITGQLTLALAFAGFLYNYFSLGVNATVAFITGILFGLSMVMNLAYLLKRKRLSRQNINVG
ncbi:hypothetical protein [Maribellus mangrovi]|uniref:hypothetical protein n=1 Tax=Maribellus mangrovi TaxID=3133146 RepID=UPI0030EE8666